MAEEDVESVTQERNGSDKRARWTVEPVRGSFEAIRLKSCYGSYLTASNERFLLGATGRKVVLSKLSGLDSSVEWEPVREGSKVKLKTRQGHFLRGNGGLPPWRDSVTHDSRRSSDSFLWDVDVLETTSLALVPVATPPLHRRQSSPPMSRTSSEKSEQEVGKRLALDMDDAVVCIRNPLDGKLFPLLVDVCTSLGYGVDRNYD
ncbi:hypothetical protein Bca101_099830 [Brassica carinata]